MSKVILLAPRISKSTFASMIEPVTDSVEESIDTVVKTRFQSLKKSLILRYLPEGNKRLWNKELSGSQLGSLCLTMRYGNLWE